VLGTRRSKDALLIEHPPKGLKQDLLVHHLCREISPEPLDKADIAESLVADSPEASLPGLAAFSGTPTAISFEGEELLSSNGTAFGSERNPVHLRLLKSREQ